MNWEAIGSVADQIGAIGVIATLLYLAIQVRQGNRNNRVDALHQLNRDYANHTALVMRDENVTAFVKGLNSYRDLTLEERVKFDICAYGYVNVIEEIFNYGEIDRRNRILGILRDYLGTRLFAYPGLRDWWAHCRRVGFGASTQAWVDEEIERNKDTVTFWEYRSNE